jgi:hypothetical protein
MRNRRFLCRLTLAVMITLAPCAMRVALAQERTQPMLVSDRIAFRQFIILASVRGGASETDRRRREAFVKRIGLSPTDAASLNAALMDVREHLEDVSARTQTAAPASTLAQLRSRVDDVFHGADERIRAALSEEGWRRLDQFVRVQVKPQIRVYTSR